jgi:hypothetical protein
MPRKITHSTQEQGKEERDRHRDLYWFPSQFESTSSFLALPMEFTIITKDYKLLKHTTRDFQCSSKPLQETSYAQAQKQETSYKLHKETNKCLNTWYKYQCSE